MKSKKQNILKRAKNKIALIGGFISSTFLAPVTASAAGLDTVNRVQSFILDIVAGIGVIFIGFGAISLAISFQSHDDSQRSKAIMSIVGGAIAVSVRLVLDALGVAHQ